LDFTDVLSIGNTCFGSATLRAIWLVSATNFTEQWLFPYTTTSEELYLPSATGMIVFACEDIKYESAVYRGVDLVQTDVYRNAWST